MSGHGGRAELEATPPPANPISSAGANAQGFAGESSVWLYLSQGSVIDGEELARPHLF